MRRDGDRWAGQSSADSRISRDSRMQHRESYQHHDNRGRHGQQQGRSTYNGHRDGYSSHNAQNAYAQDRHQGGEWDQSGGWYDAGRRPVHLGSQHYDLQQHGNSSQFSGGQRHSGHSQGQGWPQGRPGKGRDKDPPPRGQWQGSTQAPGRSGKRPLPPLSHLRCSCDSGGPQGCIYQAGEHALPLHDARGSLLGSHGQLCAAFFHTHASTEAGNDELCLDPSCCMRKPNVVLVLRVERVRSTAPDTANGVEQTEPLYIARYTNCMANLPRGGRQAVHAEQFLMDDPVLTRILRAEPVADESSDACEGSAHGSARAGGHLRMTMYLTQQPCHYSSGRVENASATAKTSCSELLVEWQRAEALDRRRIERRIRLSRLFRAHWTDDSVHTSERERQVMGSRAAAARDGLAVLIKAGWSIGMLDEKDWDFLLAHADPYVADRGAEDAAASQPVRQGALLASVGQGIQSRSTFSKEAESSPADAEASPAPQTREGLCGVESGGRPSVPESAEPCAVTECGGVLDAEVGDGQGVTAANAPLATRCFFCGVHGLRDADNNAQWWESNGASASGVPHCPWRRVAAPDSGDGDVLSAEQLKQRTHSAQGTPRSLVDARCRHVRRTQDLFFVEFLRNLKRKVLEGSA